MAYQYRFVDVLARGLENAAARAERAEAARVQQQQFGREMSLREQEARRTAAYRENVLAGQQAEAEATAAYRENVLAGQQAEARATAEYRSGMLGIQQQELDMKQEDIEIPAGIAGLFGQESMSVKRSDLPAFQSFANTLYSMEALNARTAAQASEGVTEDDLKYSALGIDTLEKLMTTSIASLYDENGKPTYFSEENPGKAADVAQFVNDLQAEWYRRTGMDYRMDRALEKIRQQAGVTANPGVVIGGLSSPPLRRN